MAGARSLQDDILALVRKHSDTCLPEDLLLRLAEEARLMGVKEKIRSLHEADPFGLFSEPRDDDDEEDQEAADNDEADAREGDGDGDMGRKPAAAVLPANVKLILDTMKITRMDKVAALNGFSSIDAEVEFSRPKSGTAKTNPAGKRSASHAPPSTLSEATVAAAAAAAVASAGPGADDADADADTDAEKGSSSSSNGDEEDEDEDPEAPVFLTFRFRREPLPQGNDDAAPEGSSCGSSEAPDSDEEDEEPPAKAAGKGSSGELAKVLRENGDGRDHTSNGGSKDAGGAGKEGRKRAGSGGVGGEGGGGGETARKRPKGAAEGGGGDDGGEVDVRDEEDAGAEEGEEGITVDGCTADEGECFTGCCPDEAGGLNYDPRTLVSYSISGGIGFKPAQVLLQAVVYARGDGPACVMPPPEAQKGGGGGDDGGTVGDDNDDAEEKDEEGSVSNDQEDVFDCNVNGPALAAVGRALGLHTEEDLPSSSDSDAGSDSEPSGREKTKRQSRQMGGDETALAVEGSREGPEEGNGSMTLSDLVWWMLMFPFFEQEFDMVEVVASSVFGEDEDEDEDDSEDSGAESDAS